MKIGKVTEVQCSKLLLISRLVLFQWKQGLGISNGRWMASVRRLRKWSLSKRFSWTWKFVLVRRSNEQKERSMLEFLLLGKSWLEDGEYKKVKSLLINHWVKFSLCFEVVLSPQTGWWLLKSPQIKEGFWIDELIREKSCDTKPVGD